MHVWTIASADSLHYLQWSSSLHLPFWQVWFYHARRPPWASSNHWLMGMLLFGVDAKIDLLAYIPKSICRLTVPQKSHRKTLTHVPIVQLCGHPDQGLFTHCWEHLRSQPEAISTQFLVHTQIHSTRCRNPQWIGVGNEAKFLRWWEKKTHVPTLLSKSLNA